MASRKSNKILEGKVEKAVKTLKPGQREPSEKK